VVDDAERVLFGVSERRIARELVPVRQVLSEYYDRIEYLTLHRGELIGIPTGFVDLDKLLGGLQRSDMVILAARPSVGKSSLALSIAHNAAKKHNQRVAFFTLEMSNEQIVQRLISAETGINSQSLRRGEIEDHQWGRFVKATNDLAETHFYVDDTPGVSALELRTKARRLHSEVGVDLVVVDYLQLMRGDVRSENRVQEISAISRGLKALARELDVPVLALSQLSRSVESRTDKRPMLSDLRESGALEQDADVVIFIYRDEMYNENTERPNIADIIVAKHRNGPTGTISLYFKRELAQFREAELRRTELDAG
jgi:replicative DNA helicase